MRILCLVVLAACEQPQPEPPRPVPTPTPVPPPPADAAPPIDAPPVLPNLQCRADVLPKNYFVIKTDLATMKGQLIYTATGPVPTRVINYRAVPQGANAYDLVFQSFDERDYHEMNAPRPAPPRKKLVVDKSVVARVYLEDGKSRIVGVEVDLHTGAQPQNADHSYGCMER